MHHDIIKRTFSNIFKKNKITKEIVDYCCSNKL